MESEILIYDFIGQNYYEKGKMKTAFYFHTRFSQSQLESQESSVRKIANEVLADYEKNYIYRNSDDKNLNGLFIEYLCLPISNFEKYPETKVSATQKTYDNYVDGHSPRKGRNNKIFDQSFFDYPEKQIKQILSTDPEFLSDIPNPDIHRNF